MSAPLNCEQNEMVEETRFVYNGNKALPSLQEMASFQVALAIWNGYISRCSANEWGYIQHKYHTRPSFVETFGLYSTYREDTDTLVDGLKTPRRIERILKTSLETVSWKMQCCVLRFYRGILFCHYPYECGISIFKPHWCVWQPNGEIDYLKTAEMMVSSENKELKLEAKFAIMCEFYMEEKLKTFPMDSLSAELIRDLRRIYVVESTSYWVHYLNGDRCEEINAYKMVAKCILTDGIGGIRINHFWHRLSEDDQVKAVYNILVERSSFYRRKWEAVEPFFGRMSWDQQQRFLAMPGASKAIIISSCRYPSSSKCAVWAWRHCRDVMSGEEFCDMIKEIVEYGYDGAKEFLLTMAELWDLAHDNHKNMLVNKDWYFGSILFVHDDRFSATTYYTPASYNMLNKSLALKSMHERKALMMKYSETLTIHTLDQRYIQEVLDLNLPHIDDQIEYKKFVWSSKELLRHCANLLLDRNFNMYNKCVKFYSDGNIKSICEYNLKVLSYITSDRAAGVADKSVIADADKWHEWCQFIDEILSNGVANASIVKQQLVSRFLKYQFRCNRVCKHLTLALKNVESVFSNEADLNRVKNEFIKAHPELKDKFWTRDDICDDEYFHNMIEWCCDGNEDGVVQLKNKIQTHDIMFDIVFFQLNKVYVTEAAGLKMSLLTRLDKYLSWYLASDDEIMAYKMHRLNESDKLKIFSTISQQRDEASLKMLLGWFFKGDEEKIRNFGSKKMKF